jgi:hypothetical protein
MKNNKAHKENLKYYRNLYEIVDIQKARYICAPLFGGSPLVQVHGNDLKPYNYAELLDLLPDDIKTLMGENMSPEDLKANRTNVPTDVPKDFQDWGLLALPTAMKLRNRISPASLLSLPALSLSNSSISKLSHTSKTTTTYSTSSGSQGSSSSSGFSGPTNPGDDKGYPVVRDPSKPINVIPPFDNQGQPWPSTSTQPVSRIPFVSSTLGDRTSLSLPTSVPSAPANSPASSQALSLSSSSSEEVMNLQTDGTGKIFPVPRKITYLPAPPLTLTPIQKLRDELNKRLKRNVKSRNND